MKQQPKAVGAGDFARFLAWLDPDPERAAQTYNTFQRKLTMLFTGRGCGGWSSELASQTLDRAIEKFCQGGIEAREPWLYLLRIARYLYQEHLRRPETDREAPEPWWRGELWVDRRCLKLCLSRFSNNDQDLLLDWEAGEKGGEGKRIHEIAAEIGIAPSALRQRIHRLKEKLGRCMMKCVQTGHRAGRHTSANGPMSE